MQAVSDLVHEMHVDRIGRKTVVTLHKEYPEAPSS